MKTNSGKLLIAAMLAAGVLAAGASWWFRFAATHQAARFWGPEAAQLIRDAEQVDLLALEQAGGPVSDSLLTVAGVPWRIAGSHDVSQAPGLTHLRNALLEDRSFDWPAQDAPAGIEWTHGLRFRAGPAPPLVILFSSDFGLTAACFPDAAASQAISCKPIAKGLREVTVEWTSPTGVGR